jgi:hypothetical protein
MKLKNIYSIHLLIKLYDAVHFAFFCFHLLYQYTLLIFQREHYIGPNWSMNDCINTKYLLTVIIFHFLVLIKLNFSECLLNVSHQTCRNKKPSSLLSETQKEMNKTLSLFRNSWRFYFFCIMARVSGRPKTKLKCH